MAFIKRHLVLLSCGAVAVLSLAALVAGYFIGDLTAEMENAGRLAGELSRLRGSAVNDKCIDAAKARSEAVLRDYESVLRFVRQVNARKPLRDDVFPEPKSRSAVDDFKRDYETALRNLPRELNAGAEPSQAEIESMRERMLRARQKTSKQTEIGLGTGERTPGGLGGGLEGPAPGGFGAPRFGEPATPVDIRERPEVRASLERARQLQWYISPGALYVHRDAIDVQQPPARQIWYAQVSLWLQQDVLKALADLNKAEADRLRAQNRPNDAWVANMPVKELVSFQFGDYLVGGGAATPAAMAAPSSFLEAAPAQSSTVGPVAQPSFTKRTSGGLYDVVTFSVMLVIDAQALPSVLDAISGANFFVPQTVTYRALRQDPSMTGKIYGTSPLIQVRIDIEGCMFRDFYHAETLMPPDLKAEIVENRLVARGATPGGGGMLR